MRPIRVTLPTLTGAGGPLIVRKPAVGTSVPVAATLSAGATIVATTDEFSTWVVLKPALGFFDSIGCYVPDSCQLSCSLNAMPPACSGSCSATSAGFVTSATRQAATGTNGPEIQCTCNPGISGRPPARTAALRLPVTALFSPLLLLYTVATHCGWPCTATGTGGMTSTGGTTGTGGTGSAQPACPDFIGNEGTAICTKVVDGNFIGVTPAEGAVLGMADYGKNTLQ